LSELKLDLSNLTEAFPDHFTLEQRAKGQTLFLKKLSLDAHRFYRGKIQILPKAPVYGLNWFNVWYTPGVSQISTTIRDDNDASLDLTSRGNMVAVVSDSTRVLGDGDCTPPGGMGVMEGKAFLMKYLGGVDAVPICMDSRDAEGRNDPEKIIDFVRRLQPSFGAINLEDISQPNCFRVLDELRETCDIPVWHDDAQGTACVTLAGVINALKLAGKRLQDVRIVMLGAGAAMTSIARLLIRDGADPDRLILFDVHGSLHKHRYDIQEDARFYRAWELCRTTNPASVTAQDLAFQGADVLIAASAPGPNTVKPEWIRSMAPRAIVFVCANPIPEIYPYAAKEAGAFIVGTGRGDFPNQVNNSLCFPGLLKGALLVRARKITDGMAIRAAHSIAGYAERKGLDPDHIMPSMEDLGVYSEQAADVAEQAMLEGVARVSMTREEVLRTARHDIDLSQRLVKSAMDQAFIQPPPRGMLQSALDYAIERSGAQLVGASSGATS
jgi:malate dehydrogenase (oxaloacetate-decarboxylating)